MEELIPIFNFWEPFDEQEYSKLIRSCESQFRKSPEYSMFLSMNNRDIDAVTGLTSSEDNIDIELHHSGMTLYEITEDIINRMVDNNLMINSHYICLILSDLHLKDCVTTLPLSITMHKKLHKIGEGNFFCEYPQIENYVHYGNKILYNDIINKHIEILKTISYNNN